MLLRTGDFVGYDAVAESDMRSSAVRENDAPIRCAKHFPAAAFRPCFEPPWPVEARHSWSMGAFYTAPHAPVTLRETASFSALYEHGEARHLCRNPSLSSVRSP